VTLGPDHLNHKQCAVWIAAGCSPSGSLN
jgi:hypothetical protein